tara:strand:+ start:374 stop:778 length:405 start_codon:yes stop_codon:yes gene_type:complete
MQSTKVDYSILTKGFIIQSLIWASISTATIEIRHSIYSNKQKPITFKNNFFQNTINYIFYTLRIIPYQLSYQLNLLNKKGEVPEYIKALYTFTISFLLSLFIYHFFLVVLGYKDIYKYFFGWTQPKGIRINKTK